MANWTHKNALSFLINFALDSLKVESIEIEKRQGKETITEPLRPQTHVLIQAPKGSFKSSALDVLSKFQNTPVFTDVTFASLVGSIDKETKQILPAGAWRARRNVLLIDEWAENNERKNVINALLQLTESGKYARTLARYSAPIHEKDRDLYFKGANGQIEVKTKFALVLATMKNILRSTNDETQALISRTIPYSFKLSQDEIIEVLSGEPLVAINPKKRINPKVTIKYDDFKNLLHVSKSAKTSIFSRAFGDCARAFAIYGWRPEIFEFIIMQKNFAESQFENAKKMRAPSLENLERRPENPKKVFLERQKEEL